MGVYFFATTSSLNVAVTNNGTFVEVLCTPGYDEQFESEIAQLIQEEYAQATLEARVPPAQIVWLRAEMRAREEAARVIGRPLSHLLSENYDNRARLRQIAKEDPRVPMAIFHGMDDEIIPVGMGRELAHEFPFVDFFPIEGADHVSVLTLGRDQMISWMNR
jgi:pimeloyl-ACP methyl ester carboxylesterase